MDLRLLYPPSIAASKLRIVSNGRSHLLRVGLERSGSAVRGVQLTLRHTQDNVSKPYQLGCR